MPLSILWSLARASNLPTVWSNMLAGWVISGGGWPPWLLLGLLGGSLAYAGGCTLNDAFDASWDRQHRPERPIPSGAVSERSVWIAGGLELGVGAVLLLAAGAGWIPVCALVAAILIYDKWHKSTAWSVIPMGLCRVFLGWAAVSMIRPVWPLPPLTALWLVGIFGYIIGLTLVARREATGGSLSPSGLALMGIPLFGAGVANRTLGADFRDFLYVAVMFGLGAWQVGRILRDRDNPGRIGAAVSRMLAGIVVIDGLWVAQWRWDWAALWVALWAACLVWQRRVAAT